MENNKLYYSIGEVAEMLGEPQSVLRFWETEFPSLQPVKNKRGVRSYTEHDINLLRRIRHLTRDCGYTLDGVREQLRVRAIDDPKQEVVNRLTEVRKFLVDLKEQL
ncbi:MAG: MerR family transcriptional regulator [Bacteroidales bacterium]|nr:MerR family transcriptional regulator [Bacteroidales bacterium]